MSILGSRSLVGSQGSEVPSLGRGSKVILLGVALNAVTVLLGRAAPLSFLRALGLRGRRGDDKGRDE